MILLCSLITYGEAHRHAVACPKEGILPQNDLSQIDSGFTRGACDVNHSSDYLSTNL